jgi:hypothetical protein
MSIGHTTVMAEVAFFGVPDSEGCSQAGEDFTAAAGRAAIMMLLLRLPQD